MSTMLPNRTSATEQGTRFEWTPDAGKVESFLYKGTAQLINAKAQEIAQTWRHDGRIVASLRGSEVNGRGELEGSYARGVQFFFGPEEDGIVEELYGIDVIRDVRNAPIFQTLDAYSIAVVNQAVENHDQEDIDWADPRQQLLYRMLLHGEESYVETGFVYRRSRYRATSEQVLLSYQGINRVDPTPPALSQRMQNLIESLPDGEWLKKPPQAGYTGGGVYHLTQEWIYGEKVSVIYGGSLDYGVNLTP